jgi:hypothetical protein
VSIDSLEDPVAVYVAAIVSLEETVAVYVAVYIQLHFFSFGTILEES